MKKEIWKTLDVCNRNYEVSNYGNIRSVDRIVHDTIGRSRKLKGKNIKQSYLFGYKICNLSYNCKYYNIRVHRVVAKLFCDDYFHGCEVHHKDNNRENNYFENLICITKNEHLIEHNNGMKKIKKIDKYGNETYYDGVRVAAKINNVSHQSIVAVLKGRKPSCVGCKWYYVGKGVDHD